MVELGGEGLVVREDEGGALDGLDDLGHGEGFAGAGDAEQDLVLLAGGETGDEFADGSGLVALGLVGGGELEVHLYRIAKDRFEVRGSREKQSNLRGWVWELGRNCGWCGMGRPSGARRDGIPAGPIFR